MKHAIEFIDHEIQLVMAKLEKSKKHTENLEIELEVLMDKQHILMEAKDGYH